MRPSLSLTLFLACLSSSVASDEKPFLETPAIYESLKKFLTPASEILPHKDHFKDDTKSGAILLRERVKHIADDGTRYYLSHNLYLSKDKSGIENNSKDTFGYRKSNQEIFLIEAKTHQPDGTEIPINKTACFIQSSQEGADSDLFTDEEELVVIYPSVKQGSVTESITLIVEKEPLIPGHFTSTSYFQFGWPLYKGHTVFDLPKNFADRTRIFEIGSNIPERKSVEEGDRVLWTYQMKPTQAYKWEVDREPISTIGPLIRLSTFESWEQVGDWARSLINQSNNLESELETQIDEWTAGLESREAIISAILKRVANDVRYTGLEFGIAGYKPYDCNLVWKNKYGDCKDKANLLATALRYKGFKAHVSLINTENLGIIDEDCPSPFYFNHAITAVELDGEYLFIDPTVENVEVGDLPGGDLNRPTLVIKDNGVDIAWTPDLSNGESRHAFDLVLGADQSLSGWYRLYCKNYYKSWYSAHFESKSQRALRWDLQERIEQYFPGAKVADAQIPTADSSDLIVEAYFTLDRPAEETATSYPLSIPYISWLLHNVGDQPGRQTNFHAFKSTHKIDLTLTLPPNLEATNLPENYISRTEDYSFSGKWKVSKGKLDASLRLDQETDRIPRDAFADYFSAVKSIERWWRTPIQLTQSDAPIVANKSASEITRLPTGEGQINLINNLYPSGKNDEKRIFYFTKIKEWFPDDLEATYDAAIEIALVKTKTVAPDKMVRELDSIQRKYDKRVEPEDYARGEYILAQEYVDADRKPKALKIFDRLARDETLSPYRRGWSAHQGGLILLEEPSPLLPELTWLALSEGNETFERLIANLISYYIIIKDEDSLASEIAKLEQKFPQGFSSAIIHTQSRLEQESILDNPERIELWAALLVGLSADHSELKTLNDDLHRLRASYKLVDTFKELSEVLAQFLRKNGPKSYPYKKNRNPPERKKLMELIDKTEDESKWIDQTNLCLLYLANYSSDVEAYSKCLHWALWGLANHASHKETEAFLYDRLQGISPTNDHLHEAYFVWATSLKKKNLHLEAINVYEKLRESGTTDKSFIGVSHTRTGESYEALDRNDQAIEHYIKSSEYHLSNSQVYNGLARGLFLALQANRLEDALSLLSIFPKADDQRLSNFEYRNQIRRLEPLLDSPESIRAYWDISEAWESDAIAYLNEIGLKQDDLPDSLPLIEDHDAYIEEAKQAATDKDRRKLYIHLYQLVRSARWIPQDLEAIIEIGINIDAQDGAKLKLLGPAAKMAAAAEAIVTFQNRNDFIINLSLALFLARDLEALSKLARRTVVDDSLNAITIDSVLVNWTSTSYHVDKSNQEAYLALEKRLEETEMKTLRAQSAALLASNFMLQGETKKAKSFLNREMAKDSVKKSDAFFPHLESLQNAIKADESTAIEFSSDVRKWIESQDFFWWKHIKPFGESDLFLNGYSLEESGALFQMIPLEQAKYYFMLAQSDQITLKEKQSAFTSGVGTLATHIIERHERLPFIKNLLPFTKTHPGTSLMICYTGLIQAIEYEDPDAIDLFVGKCESFNAPFKNQASHIAQCLRLPRQSSAEILSFIDELVSQPLADIAHPLLHATVSRLVLKGDTETAKAIVKKAAAVKALSNPNQSSFELRLSLNKTLEKCLSLKVHQNSLQSRYLNNWDATARTALLPFPAYDYQSTQTFENSMVALFEKGDFWKLGLTEIADIYSRIYYRGDFDTVKKISAGLHILNQDGIASIRDDIGFSIASGIDFDIPELRNAYLEFIRNEIEPEPHEGLSIFHDAITINALLLDPNTKSFQETKLTSDYLESNRPLLELQLAYNNGNEDDAFAMLEKLEPAHYRSPGAIGPITNIAIAGQKDFILEIAQEVIDDSTYRAIVTAIESRSLPLGNLQTHIFFNSKSNYQYNWYLEHAIEQIENPRAKDKLSMLHAAANHNWKKLAKLAQKLTDEEVTYYDAFWYLGKARFELDDFEAAKSALTVYCQHRYGNLQYQAAKELLSKIDS